MIWVWNNLRLVFNMERKREIKKLKNAYSNLEIKITNQYFLILSISSGFVFGIFGSFLSTFLYEEIFKSASTCVKFIIFAIIILILIIMIWAVSHFFKGYKELQEHKKQVDNLK